MAGYASSLSNPAIFTFLSDPQNNILGKNKWCIPVLTMGMGSRGLVGKLKVVSAKSAVSKEAKAHKGDEKECLKR
jgi:hypothetical protein